MLQARKAFRESQKLLNSRHVLNRENRPARSLPRAHRAVTNNQGRYGDFFSISLSLDLVERYYFEISQVRCVFCQRVPGNIKSQHGILAGETLFLAPGFRIVQFERYCRGRGCGCRHEQSMLPRLAHSRGALQRGKGIIYGSEQRFPRPERIESARLDEALEDALVQEAGFDALAEIIKRALAAIQG